MNKIYISGFRSIASIRFMVTTCSALLIFLGSSTVLFGQTAPTEPAAATAPAKLAVVFTEKDRDFALKYLNETKDDFVGQLTGLSDAQLNFRAAPGRWTVAEIAEHIIVTEEALFGMITSQAFKGPAPASIEDFRITDMAVILAITNRSQKFTAPEAIRPNGRWKTRDELLSNFVKTRKQTIDFVKDTKLDLRNFAYSTPMFGLTDSLQAFLFVTGHGERHLMQLKEVKADAAFPKVATRNETAN